MIDTTIHLETPEGIDLVISPAGPIARGLAMSIDFMIRQTASMAVLIGLSFAGQAGIGIYFILLFLSEWFYPVFFEVLGHGQTPGKRALGLRVIHRDGTPIGWSTSIVRNLLLIVDFLPLFYIFRKEDV